MLDLELIYRRTLQLCAPETLIRSAVRPGMPRDVVAIGKCAGGLLDGVAAAHDVRDSLVIVPRGYPDARHAGRSTLFGAHPLPDEHSFAAGEALIDFVRTHDEILFLISGGGSACVEAPLEPWFTRGDILEAHRAILDAGISIAEMNVVRKQLSAIKGGRLASAVRGRSHTLLYSDVATGDFASVASGPTVPDSSTKAEAIDILTRVRGCDRIVTKLREESVPSTVHSIGNATWEIVADNSVLVRTAARLIEESGGSAVTIGDQVETDVAEAVRRLASQASGLAPGEVLVAGGEPTVVKRGSGKGGRCLELAVRYALEGIDSVALFGSSDGLDGNSGVAGALVEQGIEPGTARDRAILEEALNRSDSLSAVARIGRPIIIPPTGNNLRDLYLLART